MEKGGTVWLFKMEIMGKIETDAVITNPQVPQDSIALQLPLAQSSEESRFDCLQQSLCVCWLRQDTVPCGIPAIPEMEDSNRIFRMRETAIYLMVLLNVYWSI